MNIDWVRESYLTRPHTTIAWEDPLVFKIGGRRYGVLAVEPDDHWLACNAPMRISASRRTAGRGSRCLPRSREVGWILRYLKTSSKKPAARLWACRHQEAPKAAARLGPGPIGAQPRASVRASGPQANSSRPASEGKLMQREKQPLFPQKTHILL